MEISLPGDLAEFVRAQVESGRSASEGEIFAEGVRLLMERKATPAPNGSGEAPASDSHKPIWEAIAEISAQVPEEVWSQIPKDLSTQHDHYLYGSPKRPG